MGLYCILYVFNMKNLFVYGSLMYDEVLNRLVGTQYQKMEAILPGYQCLQVAGEVYPALLKRSSKSTKGHVLLEVSQRDLNVLDRFEGKYYIRSSKNILVGSVLLKADVYLFREEWHHLLSNEEWDPCAARESVIQRFLNEIE